MCVAHRFSSGLVRKNNHARFPYIIEHPCLPCAGILRGREGYARMVRRAEKGGLRRRIHSRETEHVLGQKESSGDRKVFSEMETEMRELRVVFGY